MKLSKKGIAAILVCAITAVSVAVGVNGIMTAIASSAPTVLTDVTAESARVKESFNSDWLFEAGYPTTDDGADDYMYYTTKNGNKVSVAGDTTYNYNAWEEIETPHTWTSTSLGEDGFDEITYSKAFYRKVFIVPDACKDGRIYIEFDAVFRASTVYVNGQMIGEHRDGYSRFRYDITDYVNFGSENAIAVLISSYYMADVAPLDGDFTKFGGITGDVSIIYANDVHIDLDDLGSSGVYFTPSRNEGTNWNLNVKSNIVNTSNVNKNLTVKTTVKYPDSFENISTISEDFTPFDESTMYGDEVLLTDTAEITVSASGSLVFNKDLTVDNPRLWNGLSDPFRYEMILEIYDGEKLVDSVSEMVGFRYFVVDPEKGFFLNGESYPLRGVAYHEDFDGSGSAMIDSEWETTFGLVYEIGANYVRLAHYQHDPYSYELCDKYGIVVWTEIPNISVIKDDEALFENLRTQLKELIRQTKNRASVCFYGMQNELGVGSSSLFNDSINDCINGLVSLSHTEDPSRLTIMASNSFSVNGSPWHTDIIAFNTYPQWYVSGTVGSRADAFKNTSLAGDKYWAGRAMGISEYGGGASTNFHSEYGEYPDAVNAHTEEYMNKIHESAIADINARDYLSSTAVWAMFDFSSCSRREGENNGINDKGLVTRDRKIKKDSFFLYKANWISRERDAFAYITSRRMTEREVQQNTVTVYSNLDSVELFRDGASLGIMENTGNGIFKLDVDFGTVDKEYTYEARAVSSDGNYSAADTVKWTRVLSDNTEFTLTDTSVNINEDLSTILFPAGYKTADVPQIFKSLYNMSVKVMDVGGANETASELVSQGMIIRLVSESGDAVRDYNVVASSIALGKEVTVSSEKNTTNIAENAVDGDLSTRWEGNYKSNTEYLPGTLLVDLGKEYTLTRAITHFYEGTNKNYIYYYNIYAGNDPDKLTLVVNKDKSSANPNTVIGTITDSLNNITARYIKIEITYCNRFDVNNGEYYKTVVPAICELEVNGYALSSDIVTFDHTSKTVTVPQSSVDANGNTTIEPQEVLNTITVDGNALLSIDVSAGGAYYITSGDKLLVRDYAGNTTEYTIQLQ